MRLRRLFENGLLGIFFYRYDGGVDEANDAFLHMVGYDQGDLAAGRVDWHALTPARWRAQDEAKVAEVKATGRCAPFEKEYVHADGRRVPVLVGAAGVDEAGGVAFVLDLSERKRLERERHAAAEQRQLAVDAAAMGTCRFDFEAATVARDARALEVFGADRATGPVAIAAFMEAVHPDDLADVQWSLSSVMRGEPCQREFRIVREDGAVREVVATGLPTWTADDRLGPPTGMTAALRDVTEAAEAARRAALLAEVLENTTDFVGVATDAGVIDFINRSGRELLGRTDAELSGQLIAEVHPDEALNKVTTEGLPAAAKVGTWSGDTELVRRDGRRVPVSQTIAAHRDADGRVTHFSTICRDISERLRAEAVTKARREALSGLAAGGPLPDAAAVLARAAEELLPTPNLVCVLLKAGADGRPAPRREGEPERLRLLAAPSLPDSFKDGVDGLAADESGGACGAAAVRNERVVVEDLSKDPLCEQFRDFTERHELRAVWSTPIRCAAGNVLGTFAVYHDHARRPDDRDTAVVDPLVQTAAVVIERAASDVRVEAANDRLREANAMLEVRVAARTKRVRDQKDRLARLARGLADAEARERKRLAHAVHDDLQQILAAAKMTNRYGGTGEEVGRLLDEAIDEARNLTQDLVPTVLYDRGPVPALAALCRRTAERFDAAVTFTGSALAGSALAGSDEPAGGDGPAEPDPPPADLLPQGYEWGPLLYQAARELLFNAVKHAPGAPVRVSLTTAATGGGGAGVTLTVSNPPPPAGGRDRPVPADRPDRYAGEISSEGFGLFSLREQVGLAGGTMTTGPGPGGGFVVSLTLPAMFDVPDDDAPPTGAEADHEGPLRVMIVDDHRIVRSALAGLLRGTEGIEVIGEAADGLEAVERVEVLHPDAIVMDVTMPRMDGIEATRRVKQRLPQTRIVALSMHTREDMAEAMCAAGAEAYVPKGGPPEDLLNALLGRAGGDDACEE